MKKYILILAAGKGTRMKSALPKVLHEAVYHPILSYVLRAAKEVGADDVCTVVGHGADEVKAAFEGQTSFVLQREQKGTGHAVREGLAAFEGHSEGTVLVLCGDTPLLKGETLKELCAYHEEQGSVVTVMTASLEDPFGYGRIIRNEEGALLRIVEQRDASEEERAVKEINSGVYCFDLAFLRNAVAQLQADNDQGELYLTDTIAIANKEGRKACAFEISDFEEVQGINDRVQLAAAAKVLRRRKAEELMRSGVTLVDPDSIVIDPLAEIGEDTIIEPFTVIKGHTVIGKHCVVGPDAELRDAVLGDNVTFWRSVATEAKVGDYGNIGPFAYLRPKTELSDHVKVGDFVEIKNSTIGSGSKLPHLTYIGDSDVGSRCNIACGTITCNYDGFNKTRSTIGDNVFVGCNVNLVSPVTVEDGAYIAAGSTITRDVPQDALAVAREKQSIKEGWAEDFRNKNKKD
ncbi:MAG: bifunctional UDP-N-acetylglucosamine diphosphorylase/glucosamine-1-phosphate N-acetyltransferase GlmU [Firmicutes bacterium]|nr:bifunctional UDP-N-acetylglucosamine diphosphorylase/glucosamine-1-phosphate N-acetyltransferase GlmU [Bacillota bacterium]